MSRAASSRSAGRLGTQAGPLDWQVAFGALLSRWQTALGGVGRVPANWDQARRQRPDAAVLTAAGFELTGRFEFLAEHRWTLPELAGFARTLSILPTDTLADHAAAFDDSLSAELGLYARDGYLTEDGQLLLRTGSKRPLRGGLGSRRRRPYAR